MVDVTLHRLEHLKAVDNGDGSFTPLVKLDGTASPVTIPGSVEISNDTGNPIPVSGSAAVGTAPTAAPRS